MTDLCSSVAWRREHTVATNSVALGTMVKQIDELRAENEIVL